MKKEKHGKAVITNRRARFDYELGDSISAGIQLTGVETKALRLGHGQLRGAYVTVKNGELWLINAHIHGNTSLPIDESMQTRARKLLLKKREIASLVAAKQQARTIIPTEILTRGRYIKVRIAIGKGKKHYDKRQTLKKQDEQRQIERAVRH